MKIREFLVELDGVLLKVIPFTKQGKEFGIIVTDAKVGNLYPLFSEQEENLKQRVELILQTNEKLDSGQPSLFPENEPL